MKRQSLPRLSAIIGAIALGAAGSAFAAQAGEALDMELPSMATPVNAIAAPQPMVDNSAYTSDQLRSWYHEGQKSRAEVRAELKAAQQAGTVLKAGEAGDTEAVLKARDAANLQQHEAIVAEYTAEHDRIVAQQEAEAQILALASEQPASEELLALAPGEVYEEQTVAQADIPSDSQSNAMVADQPSVQSDLTAAPPTELTLPEPQPAE